MIKPTTHWHNRFFWPKYKVKRDEFGYIRKVNYANQVIARNMNHYAIDDKPLAIVHTGPSINKINELFFCNNNFNYMGVNGAIALNNIKFSYYCVIDAEFIRKRFDLIGKVITDHEIIFFTTATCIKSLLEIYNDNDIKCKIHIIETIKNNEICHFMEKKEFINKEDEDYFFLNNYGFSLNINKGLFDYYTVSYVALQISYFLKYSKIYLLGLDMTNLSEPRFYENNDNKQPSELKIHLDDIQGAFYTSAAIFDKENISIFNLSPASSIAAFKKMNSIDLV